MGGHMDGWMDWLFDGLGHIKWLKIDYSNSIPYEDLWFFEMPWPVGRCLGSWVEGWVNGLVDGLSHVKWLKIE